MSTTHIAARGQGQTESLTLTPKCDRSDNASEPNAVKAVIVDSKTRKDVADAMRGALKPGLLSGLACTPNIEKGDWVVKPLADLKPDILIVHLHTFRSKDIDDRRAEELLLEGLQAFHRASPDTKFVIFSASFTPTQTKDSRFQNAAMALSPSDNGALFSKVIASLELLAWPNGSTERSTAASRLRLKIAALDKSSVAADKGKEPEARNSVIAPLNNAVEQRGNSTVPPPPSNAVGPKGDPTGPGPRDDRNLASWIFGSICLLYLAAIATLLIINDRRRQIPKAAEFILGFLCAVAGGFVAYFFTGELGLNFKVPFTDISGNAVGGLGVFVLVLLLWHRGVGSPREGKSPEAVLRSLYRLLKDLEPVWIGITEAAFQYTPQGSVKSKVEGTGGGTVLKFYSESGKPIQTLSMKDVTKQLTEEERKSLVEIETDMRGRIEKWRSERDKIGDLVNATKDQKRLLYGLAADMASDLEAVSNFVRQLLNADLEDHYGQEIAIAVRAAGLLESLNRDKE